MTTFPELTPSGVGKANSVSDERSEERRGPIERSEIEGGLPSSKPTVLFACIHNAGRSQMAAGFMRHLSNSKVAVFSGGSAPADQVNPIAVEVMAEQGIDIASERPSLWDDDQIREADVVVTMGCGDTCPVFPGTRYLDWDLDDPSDLGLEQVRAIRDEIQSRVKALLAELLAGS